MDRFIVSEKRVKKNEKKILKSNMDRFIAKAERTNIIT